VTAVFFDVGETLVDETRHWAGWARWLGAPELTFFATLGALLARGEEHGRVFEVFRPGFDLERERAARRRAGDDDAFDERDLYPDAAPCLRALRGAGCLVGVAGNQSDPAMIARLGAPADLVTCAGQLGASKPSTEFFERIADLARRPAGEIAYVGDRLDHDILPAMRAGMLAVHIRRGPWALLEPGAACPCASITSLAELPATIAV
jgi:FMN phosphatase YigB (HAD superfamily)